MDPTSASSSQVSDMALTAVERTICVRRTVKPEKFNDRQIPREILEHLLKAANCAPTHKLTEPWLFSIFTSSGRVRLGEFQAKLYKEVTPAEEFRQVKFEKILGRPLAAPCVIALGVKTHPDRLPEIEEIAAASCAVQNIMLSAESRGISSYWGSGGVTFRPEMLSWLGWSEGDRALGYLYLGYSDFDPGERRRRFLQERVKWIED